MKITRTFVWRNERPDDHDEIRSGRLDHHLLHDGVRFELRGWDIRYTPGEPRVTEATYDEA